MERFRNGEQWKEKGSSAMRKIARAQGRGMEKRGQTAMEVERNGNGNELEMERLVNSGKKVFSEIKCILCS